MPISSARQADGKEVIITIEGRFSFPDHKAFRDAYLASEPKQTRFIIDMKKTEYIDSAALGMLLVLKEKAGGDSANIKTGGDKI